MNEAALAECMGEDQCLNVDSLNIDSLTIDQDSDVSELEFRNMVKKSQVDLLLCVFNLWKTTQTMHEDMKTTLGHLQEDKKLTERLSKIEKLLLGMRPKRENLLTALSFLILVSQAVLLIALLHR